MEDVFVYVFKGSILVFVIQKYVLTFFPFPFSCSGTRITKIRVTMATKAFILAIKLFGKIITATQFL